MELPCLTWPFSTWDAVENVPRCKLESVLNICPAAFELPAHGLASLYHGPAPNQLSFLGVFLVNASKKSDVHVVCVYALEPHSRSVHTALCIPNFLPRWLFGRHTIYIFPLLPTKCFEDTKTILRQYNGTSVAKKSYHLVSWVCDHWKNPY